MNNTKTITLTIVAVFMAATLVVGTAGSFATKTAFAASNNNNGNTVTIEECKNRGSASGFDTALDQECENLICTHPGPGATCVSEPGNVTPPTPTTGTLEVKKVVKCLDTIRVDGCQNTKFKITVTDTNPNPSEFTLGDGDSQLVTLGAGSTYTVSEPEHEGFIVKFSGDCPTGTIAPGDQKTCTITNQQQEK
jgi:hypothetical protein